MEFEARKNPLVARLVLEKKCANCFTPSPLTSRFAFQHDADLLLPGESDETDRELSNVHFQRSVAERGDVGDDHRSVSARFLLEDGRVRRVEEPAMQVVRRRFGLADLLDADPEHEVGHVDLGHLSRTQTETTEPTPAVHSVQPLPDATDASDDERRGTAFSGQSEHFAHRRREEFTSRFLSGNPRQRIAREEEIFSSVNDEFAESQRLVDEETTFLQIPTEKIFDSLPSPVDLVKLEDEFEETSTANDRRIAIVQQHVGVSLLLESRDQRSGKAQIESNKTFVDERDHVR